MLIKSTQTGPPLQYLAPEQITGSQEDDRSVVAGNDRATALWRTGSGGCTADDHLHIYSGAAAPAAAVYVRPPAEARAGDYQGTEEKLGPLVPIGAGEHHTAAPDA